LSPKHIRIKSGKTGRNNKKTELSRNQKKKLQSSEYILNNKIQTTVDKIYNKISNRTFAKKINRVEKKITDLMQKGKFK